MPPLHTSWRYEKMSPYPFTLSVAMRDPHAEPPFRLCWPSSQQGSHYWAQPSKFRRPPPNSRWRCVRSPDHTDTQIQLRWGWGNETEHLHRYAVYSVRLHAVWSETLNQLVHVCMYISVTVDVFCWLMVILCHIQNQELYVTSSIWASAVLMLL